MSYNSNDAEQYFQKVIDYVKSQKYNEAIPIECFKALKNIDPKHVCAWFYKIVTILADSKRYEEAIQFVDKTLKDKDIRIDPVYVLAGKAIVLYHKKCYEKAMEYVEKIQKNTKFDSDAVASLHANLKFDSDSVETLH